MNPTHITFPPPQRELRLRRPPVCDPNKLIDLQAALAKGQKTLQSDNEALRQREENLQAYEQRLRDLQNQVEGSSTEPSSPDQICGSEQDPTLEVAWSKLHRTRELLEVEQRQLSDDQHILLQAREVLRLREADLLAREQAVASVEAQLKLAEPETPKPSRGLFGITRAPFKLPKSVFVKS